MSEPKHASGLLTLPFDALLRIAEELILISPLELPEHRYSREYNDFLLKEPQPGYHKSKPRSLHWSRYQTAKLMVNALGALAMSHPRFKVVSRHIILRYSVDLRDHLHETSQHTCAELSKLYPWYSPTESEKYGRTGESEGITMSSPDNLGLEHLCHAIRDGNEGGIERIMDLESVSGQLVRTNAEIEELSWHLFRIVTTPSHPIFEAVRVGNLRLAKLLLQKNPKAHAPGSDGVVTAQLYAHPAYAIDRSPIELACELGDAQMLRLLLNSAVMDEQLGEDLMSLAIPSEPQPHTWARRQCVKEIIRCFPKLGRSMFQLTRAAEFGDKELYDLFEDVDVTAEPSYYERHTRGLCAYPLFAAMMGQNLDIFEDLLSRGAVTAFGLLSYHYDGDALGAVWRWRQMGHKYAKLLAAHYAHHGSPRLSQETVRNTRWAAMDTEHQEKMARKELARKERRFPFISDFRSLIMW